MFQKQQSSRSHGTRHDLRPYRPPTTTGCPGLNPPVRLSFCFVFLMWSCGLHMSLATRVHGWVVRQALFDHALAHTYTLTYIHTHTVRLLWTLAFLE